ncbi:hypothetical protein ACFQ0X_07360 [Streptomyces rectiviolaceus]|uniref:Uncharacterized protein n=1 Tax=Streptomyces rectiviolaceus TaxID=332591 RepID=A0ABP6NJG5_9ACTN
MTVSPDRPELAHGTAALCALLGSPDDMRQPGVQEAAERARDVLQSGAGADEIAECYETLDHAMRRAGDAGGLVNGSRGAMTPGLAQHIRVAVCPGPAHCSRLERARDLLPAPHCAVNGARMRKGRLDAGQ